MKYITELLYTALVCGLLSKLSASGESKNGKYVRFVSSIVFLLMLLRPIMNITGDNLENYKGFLDGVNEAEESMAVFDTEYDRAFIEVVTKEICREATKAAAEKFSVNEECFTINANVKYGDGCSYSINEVNIHIKDAQINKKEAELFFRDIFEGVEKVVIS